MTKYYKALILILFLIGFLRPVSVLADDYYFVGNDNRWDHLGNWVDAQGHSYNNLPSNNDNVFITSDFLTGNKLVISQSISINSLTVKNLSDVLYLTVNDDAQINISQGLVLSKMVRTSGNGSVVLDEVKKGVINVQTDLNWSVSIKKSEVNIESPLRMFEGTNFELDNSSLSLHASLITYKTNFNGIKSKDIKFIDNNVWIIQGAYDLSWTSNNLLEEEGFIVKSFSRDVNTCGTIPFTIETNVSTDYNGSDISCNGESDAEVCVTITGGVGPFTINWVGGPSTACWNGLSSGTYTVVVTDQGQTESCVVNISVSEPSELTTINFSFTEPTCNGDCDGTASHLPFGGTGTLTFLWTPSGSTAQNPTGLCAGNNQLTITDDNGCTFDTTFTLTEPDPVTINTTATDVQCNGDCEGQVTSTTSGGTGSLSLQWYDCTTGNPIPGETNAELLNQCPGSYYLEVTDDNSCVFTNQTTCDVIAEPTPLTATNSNIVDASCSGVCDGEAQANPSGGTAPYTVDWIDDNTGSSVGTGTTINTLCAGDYFAEITDANGCVFTTPVFTVVNGVTVIANATSTDISCFGLCDGSASATPVGGTGPFSYQWETIPGGLVVGGSASVNGLCPGDHQVVITDANGCISNPAIVTINEPAQITLTLSANDNTCFNSCDGDATVVPSGGNAPYSYVWSPNPPTGQGTDNISGLCAGNYVVTVTDNNGCQAIDDIDVNEPPQYDITSASTDIVCNGDCDGTASVTVNNGGTPGYTYTWTPAPPTGQGTPTASDLCSGNISVLIEDTQGCDTTFSFNISEPPALNVNASVISDPSCNGDCNGSAQVFISGGVSPFTISWDDPSSQSTSTASGLCAGTYNVTVTDANGCSTNDNVTLTEPSAFGMTITSTDVDCFGNCNGTGSVTVNSGGTGPYTIDWNDPLNQTSFNASALCAGSYNVEVTDANGCDTVFTVTINEPSQLTQVTTSNNAACNGICDGDAQVTPSGGTSPYTINWFNTGTGANIGSGPTISGLCAGNYEAVITDDNGCIITSDPVTITELPPINVTTTVINDAGCNLCDGEASATATGGSGTFVSYTWSPGGQTGQNVNTLCGGISTVTVTDDNGCTGTGTVGIINLAAEVVTVTSNDASCFGVCDGDATASFTCLDPPCNVEWFDATTGSSTGQTTTTATNLCAGDYYVQLTNGSGCIRVENVTINEPPQITSSITSTDANCNGACDGTATVTAGGGAGGFTYVWTPLPGSGQGTPSAGGLCAGGSSVTVTDVNGCSVIENVTISEPTVIDASNVSSSDVSCNGNSDGTLTVIPNGGTAPYTYQWVDCFTGTPVPGLTNQTETNVAPGDYFAEVTDANGCVVNSPCTKVNEPAPLGATFNIININCSGVCSGNITASPSGGSLNYTMQWLDGAQNPIPGQTAVTIANLCAGTYYYELTDLSGCSDTLGPVNIVEPNPWDINIAQTDENCFNACDGSATVIVNGGNTPPYSYAWNDPSSQTNATATGLCAGNYDVVITDAAGCDTTISFTINPAQELFANVTVTEESCFGSCDAALTTNPSGGDGTYSITWSPGGQTTNTVSGLCAGSYDLNIIDGNGCSIDTTIVIDPQSEIISNITTNTASCGNCNGSAIASPTGGAGGYTYNWSPAPGAGQGTNNATSLCSGIYTLTITDASGCSINEGVSISDVDAETITTTTVDVSCFGDADGEATVSYTCGDPACSQVWYDNTGAPIGQTGLTATGLTAGDYTVEVINNTGCISLETVTINEPPQIIANEILTDVTCTGVADGQIEVNPTGGSGTGYTYNWVPAPGGGQGTNIATGLTGGTWEVTITDSDGCSETFQYILNSPLGLTATFNSNNNTCASSCDGSIVVVPSGGTAPYTYQWLDGSGTAIPGETADNIQNLCSGNYNVEITDATGCIFTFTNPITISQPVAITAPINSTDVVCNGACDGFADVSVSGGVAPYTIDWYDGTNTLIGQTGDTAFNLCPGDYYAIITDANGCTFNSNTVTITEPAALVDNLSTVDAGCFGTCDGSATVAPGGGTAPYTYNWQDASGNPLPGGNMASVSNLCTGNYQVTNTDDNGCQLGPVQFTINSNPQLNVTVTSNDAACGNNDGTANVVVTGGTSPYSYQWQDNLFNNLPGETNALLQNVGAGIYYVVVTDASGCTETFQATINNPNTSNVVIDNVTDVSCFGACDGSIDITATPINGPLTFVWNPGGITDEDPQNLCAGTYTLEVTDALGCINYYDTTVNDATEIQGAFTAIDATCGQCDGELVVNASGGAGGYSFNWTNGATGSTASNLCAGVYDVLITDANGCTNTLTSSISDIGGPTGEDVVVVPSACNGDCNGEITVTAQGGTPPYTYFWPHDGSSGSNITGLCAGTYFVQMQDDNGCIRTVEIEIPDQDSLEVQDIVNPPTCGNTDGSISIASSGGSLPHTYLWNTGSTNPSLTNIGAGFYQVSVIDDNGCSEVFTFTINDFNAPDIVLTETDILCFGNNDGSIDANITGGTAPYNINWLDGAGNAIGQTASPATNLAPGDYTIEVTDDNGCIALETGTIESPDTLELSLPVTQDVLCSGDCSGQASVIVTGGTLPYSYSWNDPSSQTTSSAIGLCTGSYDVTVTDDNGCQVTQSATINEPTAVAIAIDTIIDASCGNTQDGEIQITVTGGSSPYSYSWTSDDPSFTSSDEDPSTLLPGSYYLEVTDDNGCTELDTLTVEPGDSLGAQAPSDTLICFGEEHELIGTFTGTGINFTQWTDTAGNVLADSTHAFVNPGEGQVTYIFTVSNGSCTDSDTVVITFGAPLEVDAGLDVEVIEYFNAQIGGSPTTPSGNSVVWTPPTYLTDTTAANPYAQEVEFNTTYIVTVTDTNGCQASDTMELIVLPELVFPNGFSPNGDGTNDTWVISFSDEFPDMEVNVYNRWGELLYYNRGTYAPWEGRYKDELVPVGTYYYVINLNHPEYPDPFTGPLTIMR